MKLIFKLNKKIKLKKWSCQEETWAFISRAFPWATQSVNPRVIYSWPFVPRFLHIQFNQTPRCSTVILVFTTEKYLCISVSVQFEPTLFKDQL